MYEPSSQPSVRKRVSYLFRKKGQNHKYFENEFTYWGSLLPAYHRYHLDQSYVHNPHNHGIVYIYSDSWRENTFLPYNTSSNLYDLLLTKTTESTLKLKENIISTHILFLTICNKQRMYVFM